MMNYPGWMGEGEIQAFRDRYPGADVREVSGLTSGAAPAVTQLRQNQGAYDLTLAGGATGGQMDAAGLLAGFDPARVPNVEKVPGFLREAFPYGIPIDVGRVGFGYRRDLVDVEPTSSRPAFGVGDGVHAGRRGGGGRRAALALTTVRPGR